MAETTGISWCDSTFNPWVGCTKIAAGCTNCYAEADMDHRRGRVKWGPQGTRSRTSDAYWRQPLKWDRDAADEQRRNRGIIRRRRVFCASLADVFEAWDGPIVDARGETLFRCCEDGIYRPEKTPAVVLNISPHQPATITDLRRDLFAMIDQTPYLDWLLLTKRPENIRRMWPAIRSVSLRHSILNRSNVWLGFSASTQADLEVGIGHLLACQELAPVLWLSLEPLIGPINLSEYLSLVQWVVVGGESGHDARHCDLAWIRSIVQQCRVAKVPVFVKQLGSRPNQKQELLNLHDRKGGDIEEFPRDLQIREWPRGAQ